MKMRLEIFLRDATPFYAMQTSWRNNPVLFGSWISCCVEEDILAAFNLSDNREGLGSSFIVFYRSTYLQFQVFNEMYVEM